MSEPLVVVPGDEDQRRGYKVGVWGKFPNYECLRCQYSTIFETRMLKHVQEGRHPWGFEGRGTDTLHDGFGLKADEIKNDKLVY